MSNWIGHPRRPGLLQSGMMIVVGPSFATALLVRESSAQSRDDRDQAIPAHSTVVAVPVRGMCLQRMPVGDTVGVVVYEAASAAPATFVRAVMRRVVSGDRIGPGASFVILSRVSADSEHSVGNVRVNGRRGGADRGGVSEVDPDTCADKTTGARGELSFRLVGGPVASTSAVARVEFDEDPPSVMDPRRWLPVAGRAGRQRFHRNVLVIYFRQSAPDSARGSIIAAIGGQAIARTFSRTGGDDKYFVRVADDPMGNRLLDQAAMLSTLPGVSFAVALRTGRARASVR